MQWKKVGAGIFAAASLGTGGTFAADTAINPYDDKGTHYELPLKTEFQQGERVEIAKDRAAMTLKGWNDEYAITISPQIPGTTFGADKAIDRSFETQADRPLLSKKMEFRSGATTAFVEPKEGTGNEFDIDFTLDAKPDTNIFTYAIGGADEFDFFYQPELTPEEIADGAERPENVIGSYAVYHREKANSRVGSTNYATGKIFHIYRPKAIDANGAEVWAQLHYSDGILSVTVPEDFLEKATYPVVVDPTFGYTSAGASSSIALETTLEFTDFSTTEDGNIESISLWTSVNSAHYWSTGAAIYTYNSSSDVGDLVTLGGAVTTFIGSTGVSTLITHNTLNQDRVTGSTNYYLAGIGQQNGGATFWRYDSSGGANVDGVDKVGTNNWIGSVTDEGSTGSERFSIYATYNTDPACDPSSGYCTEFLYRSQSWTAPSGVTSADVACWGAGGGGDETFSTGGAGGGGGAFASSTVALTPGSSYTVTIGLGGGISTSGGDSSFVADNKTVLADGGTGATSETANGVGGTTAGSTGDVEFAGGAGGDGNNTGDTGGGGGGAGGPHGAGQAGSTANSTTGGAGGAGSNGSGGAGGQPHNGGTADVGGSSIYGGGGGGGGDNSGSQFIAGDGGYPGGGGGGSEGCLTDGCAGAAGLCTVRYTSAGGGGGSSPSIFDSEFWF
jgi:hypothetical protein